MLLTTLSGGACCVYAFASLFVTGYWAWRVWLK